MGTGSNHFVSSAFSRRRDSLPTRFSLSKSAKDADEENGVSLVIFGVGGVRLFLCLVSEVVRWLGFFVSQKFRC